MKRRKNESPEEFARRADQRVADEHMTANPDGCAETWAEMCQACMTRASTMPSYGPISSGMKAWRATQEAIYSLERAVKSADTTLAKFKESLDANPSYAFEWATDKVIAAARREVALLLLPVVKEQGLEVALRGALENALRGARWPSHSTSPMSNLVNEARTSAWADFVSDWTDQHRYYRYDRRKER